MRTFTLGPCAHHTAMLLLLRFVVLSSCSLPWLLRAQSDFERFEVASLRPGSEGVRPSMQFTPGGIRATKVTLKMLIQLAYDIRAEQVVGGPGWADSEEYTVIAKAPEGGPRLSAAEQKALTLKRLQTLLSERFQLVLKQESTPASGYALIVDKSGHKMSVANDKGDHKLRQIGRWQCRADGVEMPTLAKFLSVHLLVPVVDRTGLEGRYTFHLNWTPDPLPASVASLNGLPADSLIPAVRDQLGLKLERQKVPTDKYKIERAEKPTEN